MFIYSLYTFSTKRTYINRTIRIQYCNDDAFGIRNEFFGRVFMPSELQYVAYKITTRRSTYPIKRFILNYPRCGARWSRGKKGKKRVTCMLYIRLSVRVGVWVFLLLSFGRLREKSPHERWGGGVGGGSA